MEGSSSFPRKPVKISPQDSSLTFQGLEVEKFIRRFEAAAALDGAIDSDMVMQVVFFVKGEDLKEEIEGMEAFERGNWTQLKKEMLAK